MKLKLNLILLLCFVVSFSSVCQELDSISMSMKDGIVTVAYDFLNGEEGVDYEMYLYGSHDNFSKPLQLTTGDVGKNIRIGTSKIIYWEARKELGNFKGDFSLKIKGSKYIPFVSFKNLDDYPVFKRGHSFLIEWDKAEPVDEVLLSIRHKGTPIADPMVINNSGSYQWEIPKNAKASRGYTIQLRDTKNLIREETSKEFSIRRRFPLSVKLVPVLAAAGTLIFIVAQNKEEGIPEPPEPPQ